ncbi:MAG: tetratricopeptide repeat protein [Bacteroidetes bacterium]|nr:tetratricopeptide repeat protein [Bacteroidota bacterium]
MKRIILVAAIALNTNIGNAQKAEVQSAYSYLKYEQLDKAQEAIDKAANHETTMNMEKTWYYRGLIYQSMYKNEKYAGLSANPLEEALRSFNKCLEINPKYEYAQEIAEKKVTLSKQFSDKGYDEFTKKDFATALKSFENVISLSPTDTAIYYNAAISADKAKDMAKAKQYYAKLVEMNYNDSKFYQSYAQILLSEKDTTGALKLLANGLSRFPGEKGMQIQQTNIYIQSGRTGEALQSLDGAIAKDPTNPNLYFAKGSLQEKSGKENDAVVTYKKAIEIKPDYFDANYNLGALYFNQGAKMANEANKIQDNAKYAKAKTEFEAKFNLAKPYFEKALEINPKDESTLVSLKQLYATLNDTPNYDRVKKLLDNLK